MEKLSMCRICLQTDAKMYILVDTNLQTIYEDLTAMPLVTKDNRSTLACYICCARLKDCYKLRMRCLQSDKLLTQILANKLSKPDKQDEFCTDRLEITPVVHISMGNAQDSVDYEIKKEVPEVEVIVKREDPEEPLLQDIGDEPIKEFYITLEDSIEPMDSNDFIFLDTASEKLSFVPNRVNLEENIEIADDNTEKNKNINIMNNTKTVYNKENFRFENMEAKKTDLLEHNYRSTDEKQYKCGACLKLFGSDTRLQNHLLSHTAKYKCDICHKNFETKYLFDSHIRVHTERKSYECDKCKKIYSTKSSLARHIFLIHTARRSPSNALNNHLNLKPFTCDICEKKFSMKGSVISHLRTHTGEKPYECYVCKKSFSEKSTLNKHLLVHSDEKLFQCDQCCKAYKRKSHLDIHVRVHTDNRPFRCDICEKGFFQKVHLTDHKRVHTGVKPFACDICDYNFSYKSCLKRHMARAHCVGGGRR